MYEMVIPLRWDCIDRLLSFINDTLYEAGQPTHRRLELKSLTQAFFEAGADCADKGKVGCRIQLPNRMVLRFDAQGQTMDLSLIGLFAESLKQSGLQVTLGINSILLQW